MVYRDENNFVTKSFNIKSKNLTHIRHFLETTPPSSFSPLSLITVDPHSAVADKNPICRRWPSPITSQTIANNHSRRFEPKPKLNRYELFATAPATDTNNHSRQFRTQTHWWTIADKPISSPIIPSLLLITPLTVAHIQTFTNKPIVVDIWPFAFRHRFTFRPFAFCRRLTFWPFTFANLAFEVRFPFLLSGLTNNFIFLFFYFICVNIWLMLFRCFLGCSVALLVCCVFPYKSRWVLHYIIGLFVLWEFQDTQLYCFV